MMRWFALIFHNTYMNRGYLTQRTDKITFIITYLKSVPVCKNIRVLQIDEILKRITRNVIVFGDMNFTESDESFKGLTYIENSGRDTFIVQL
jgi:hypothetical protein